MILKISCTQNHVCQTIPKVNIDSSLVTVAQKNVLSNTYDWFDEKKSANITELRKKLGLLLVTLSVVLSLGGILADILKNFLKSAKLENYLKNLAWFLASPKISSKNEANPWQRSHQRPTLCHLKKVGFFVPLVAPLEKTEKFSWN